MIVFCYLKAVHTAILGLFTAGMGVTDRIVVRFYHAVGTVV